MTVIDAICFIVGVTGVAFGTRSYLELYRWAKQCQNARIAVSYKGRVQINAPLTDWLGWANQLGGAQKERGRIVYKTGHVSVAILRPASAKTWYAILRIVRKVRKRSGQEAPA